MNSVDLSVLHALQTWQAGELPVWLITVVETYGSSPRPPGAMLALRGDGVTLGSVSGGCIEDDLVLRAQYGQLSTASSEVVIYGGTRAQAMHFGLPCGGVMRLVIEPVLGQVWVKQLLQQVEAHNLVQRTLNLQTGKVKLAAARRKDVLQFDGSTLKTVLGPRWRMLIIGAGQTSHYLANMALALDYQVSVCEPREEMRQTWAVPDITLLSEMPDEAVLALQPDFATVIVALTHDPKLDDMALLEALKSPAFYVGALGSMANNARRRERLQQFDLSPLQIERLHGPVGLDIGSRTPPEIAVSILAQLIACRNKTSTEATLLHAAKLTQPTNQEMCS
jgi:xanthine dehydrogenase accessory factor